MEQAPREVIGDLGNSSLSEVVRAKAPLKCAELENPDLLSPQEPVWGLMRGNWQTWLG